MLLDYNGMDFIREVGANHRTVFLNFGYWLCCPADRAEISEHQRDAVVNAVRRAWMHRDGVGSLPFQGMLGSHPAEPRP